MMDKAEFLKNVETQKIKKSRTKTISEIYRFDVDEVLAKIISYADSVEFFDEERRALSFKEIENPKELIGFDFVAVACVPVVDIYDNSYVVYDISSGNWARYNVIDKLKYKERATLKEVL